MTNDQAFAALLAQVIPVILLAIVVEAHYQHDLRIRQGRGPAGWHDADLYFQMGNLTVMALLEVAALIAAKNAHPPALIRWVAGLPGAITVGILVIVMVQLYVETLVQAYAGQLWNPGRVTKISRALLWFAILVGVGAIIAVSTN
ncbi:hypothetical protein [Kitasatospora sp. NPDC090091]|uniref:hypothetical protein n=1 Tax=Kitasatospora sp. NPDC090091 TaxID=3364081 RepID=UPI00381F81C7